MKKLLSNPVMVNIEIGLIEDVIKIIGAAIHPGVSHDVVQSIKSALFMAAKKALDEQPKTEETN